MIRFLRNLFRRPPVVAAPNLLPEFMRRHAAAQDAGVFNSTITRRTK